jgi:hypothetical protein
MTPEQKQAIINETNPVRVVTIALQIAASEARNGNRQDAIEIKKIIDREQAVTAREREWRAERLRIAVQLAASCGTPQGELSCVGWLRDAEMIMHANIVLSVAPPPNAPDNRGA